MNNSLPVHPPLLSSLPSNNFYEDDDLDDDDLDFDDLNDEEKAFLAAAKARNLAMSLHGVIVYTALGA